MQRGARGARPSDSVSGPGIVPTVVVLGGINMDLIGVTPRMADAGETVVGERFYTAPGGKGGNQAVAAARMGARVKMIGRVGSDVFGPTLLDGLAGHGVDITGVAIDPDHASGIAIILLDARRQNRIVTVYGANMMCDDDQLRATEAALDGAEVLMLQLETPSDVSLRAAKAARERGVTVVWDPAPASVGLPAEAYRHLDVITPNQGEAEALTGTAVTDLGSAARAASALRNMGAPTAVVKLGEDGVFYSSDSGEGHVPSTEVAVVDTVAAGDAFGGAFAVALGEGKGLGEALCYGTCAGALAVTRQGAQDAMPGRDEVEALLAS